MRVEASIAVDGGEQGRELGLGVERRRGRDHGHLGRCGRAWCRSGVGGGDVSAESGEGEHEDAPDTEERMKECDSRGELGDMGVVEGDGVVNRDQEARAQRYRRELGEEDRRHRRSV